MSDVTCTRQSVITQHYLLNNSDLVCFLLFQRNVDNTYHGGKLNLVSVVQLWNLCLHLYLEKLQQGIQYSDNPLYTGGLCHCYMLDESICHFRGVGSILSLLLYFQWKIL